MYVSGKAAVEAQRATAAGAQSSNVSKFTTKRLERAAQKAARADIALEEDKGIEEDVSSPTIAASSQTFDIEADTRVRTKKSSRKEGVKQTLGGLAKLANPNKTVIQPSDSAANGSPTDDDFINPLKDTKPFQVTSNQAATDNWTAQLLPTALGTTSDGDDEGGFVNPLKTTAVFEIEDGTRTTEPMGLDARLKGGTDAATAAGDAVISAVDGEGGFTNPLKAAAVFEIEEDTRSPTTEAVNSTATVADGSSEAGTGLPLLLPGAVQLTAIDEVVKVPIYQFQRAGLLAAAIELQVCAWSATLYFALCTHNFMNYRA
eukprot:COSAG01_NODE_2699_length_7235_cov_5.600196_3_plen_317_part_00